jgi:3-oxoacyl-[acyl-carrier protein] reductase
MKGSDFLKELGVDRMPYWIIDKRVTELMDISGKKAIVSGAGGDGLGRAIANRLAGLGADVALIDKNVAGAEQNAEAVRKRWRTKAIPLKADLMIWDDVVRVMREAHDALGGIDILVNNPVTIAGGLFEKQTKEQIDLTVNGSLLICIYSSRVMLDYMIPQQSGRIINISSVGGRIAHRGIAVYNSCKSGVIGFTRNLAHEVAHHGIYVLGVAPGIMFNERQRQFFLNATDEQARVGREAITEGFSYQQLGRVSLPEEVANMVAYLATDAASYMIGQTIDVAGGQFMD